MRLGRSVEISELLSIANKAAENKEYMFDAALFRRLVDTVIIHSLVEATFIFRSGIELREILG